jgi:hypothetical protein
MRLVLIDILAECLPNISVSHKTSLRGWIVEGLFLSFIINTYAKTLAHLVIPCRLR